MDSSGRGGQGGGRRGFFFCLCQKHLAMAPWGATDGRATVPLDPVGHGQFGQQPFFPKTKQDHRTAEPQAVIQITKRATEQLYTYSRNYLRVFACTRQQLPAERLYMNERNHRMQRIVAESVMLYHRNSRKRIGELLISIKRGRKLSMIRGS